jgi:hypothetical protein
LWILSVCRLFFASLYWGSDNFSAQVRILIISDPLKSLI